MLTPNQDAVEYLQHLLEMLTRAERGAGARLPPGPPTAAEFRFDTEDRILCTETGRLSYRRAPAYWLGLEIPLAAAVNQDALKGFQARHVLHFLLRCATCFQVSWCSVCYDQARSFLY